MVLIVDEGATVYQPPKPIPTLTPAISVDITTPSMDFTDEEIRIHLIDDYYLKYDIPIIPYWDLAITTNWSNFKQRIDFLEALKKEIKYLITQSNGKINTSEQTRIKAIILNIAEIQTVYEESSEFIAERIEDKIEDFIEEISLPTKIIIGVGIAGSIIFGCLIGYSFLKSYGTEKGKLKARG